MTGDPELFASQIEEYDVRIGALEALLIGEDWLTAGEIIQRHFTHTTKRWSDKLIRDLAAASKGAIAGGQRGYKLVRLMSRDEMEHARNWMKSQASKMEKRADEIEIAWSEARVQWEKEQKKVS